jgi:hypothetical protein
MQAKPTPQHEWLQQLLGEWEAESEANMGPGQPPIKSKMTERVRSLGGLWFLAEGESVMPDGNPATMIMTLGYDPRTQRFTGTWLGSMMTHLWMYDGELDASGKILTLNSQGPAMSGDGSLAPYKDIIEIRNPDHRILTSHTQGEDGQWRHFMTAHYRRR